MAKRQTTLLASWLKPAKKQKAGNRDSELELVCGVGEEAGNRESELDVSGGVGEEADNRESELDVACGVEEKAVDRESELNVAGGVGEEAGNHDSEFQLASGVAKTAFHVCQAAEVAAQSAENESEPKSPLNSQSQAVLLSLHSTLLQHA